MKKIILPIVLIALTMLAFIPAGKDIDKKDRANAIAYFKETKKFLQKEISGLSENQLNWKPADSVWSIANCVEHIAVTENGIFGWAMSTLSAAADSSLDMSKKVTDDEIKTKLIDRSVKNKAPEIFKPSGRFANTREAYKAFEKKRDSLIQYMKTTKD
ncbi:MAG: DinB family protein, partial [Chitinophagaceae bacterium]